MEEMEVKEEFLREAALRSEWLKVWETIGVRILQLPEWMQDIVRRHQHSHQKQGCNHGDD
jgi:hypothetical protein